MSNKKLSTSTLSLRFMQNAHRAKNLGEVEAEKAEVKDDGEWEVSEEVKQAWGMKNIPSQTVTYEASYLPFLFPSESPGSNWANVRGRRKLNSGKEVVEEMPPQAGITHPETDSHIQEDIPHSSKRPPASISSVIASRGKKTNSPTKTAQEMIYSNSGVGTDLRPPRSAPPLPDTIPLQGGFIKPFGVDEPADRKETTRPFDQGAVSDAGSNKPVKRKRGLASNPSLLESKKPKKKKTGTVTK